MDHNFSLNLITVAYFYKYFFEFSFLTVGIPGFRRSLLEVSQLDMDYLHIEVLFMRFKIYRPEPEDFFDGNEGC